LSLNSYITKRWKLSLFSAFADALTYHKRRAYLTYAVNTATTIIAVKHHNCYIRPFYTIEVSRRRNYSVTPFLPWDNCHVRPSFTIPQSGSTEKCRKWYLLTTFMAAGKVLPSTKKKVVSPIYDLLSRKM